MQLPCTSGFADNVCLATVCPHSTSDRKSVTNAYSNRQLSYLSPWFEDVSEAEMHSLGVTGGFSGAVIWRVSVAGNDLCLRRWPQVHPSLNGLLAIHGLLQHVATAGYDLVPVPLATRFGETYFVNEDHLWELTPWMPGEAALSQAPTPDKLSTAMDALARFHQAAESYQYQDHRPTVGLSPGLQERLAILQQLQQGGLQQLWQATRTAEASDLRELAFELLEATGHSLDTVCGGLQQIVSTPLPLQWCLRDVRHDQVLFSGQHVSGLLDFGAVAVDSVAGDVARFLGSVVNEDPQPWQLGIEAYAQQRQLSVDERRAITGFDQGGLICSATNWVRWLFVEGRAFPQVHALHAQLVWLRDRLQSLATRSNASVGEPLAGPTWERSERTSRSASGIPHLPTDSPWTHT